MNKDKIIEGNKTIAEFMGGKLKYYNLSNEPYYQLNKQQWMPERLIYHTSWDWLMEVVEKIGSVDIHYRVCVINNGDVYIKKSADTKIEAVWLAVIEFIKFFNQTQNK